MNMQMLKLAFIVVTFHIAIKEEVGMIFDVIRPYHVVDIVC